MKKPTRFKLAVFVLFVNFNFGQGQNCGGVLSRNSGQFEYQPDGHDTGNCVWFIQVLRGQSIELTLDKLTQSTDVLNVYPENDLSCNSNSEWPIKLTSSDLKLPVNVTGSTVLLIWPAGNSGGFSISWRSDRLDGSLRRSSTISQTQSDGGRILWDDFEPGVVTSAWLDLSLTLSKSLSLTLTKEFSTCSQPDPCDCNSLSIFKISEDGTLMGLDRLCGGPVANFTILNLPDRIVALFVVDSPVKRDNLGGSEELEVSAKEFLEIGWKVDKEPPETTAAPTTTTTLTTTTTAAPPSSDICPQNETILPCLCRTINLSPLRNNVNCYGENVTQETLNNLFVQLRAVNNLTVDQTLQLHYLDIGGTHMTQLDLTPFINLRMTSGIHFGGFDLTSITGPPVFKKIDDSNNKNTNGTGKDQNREFRMIERSIQVPSLLITECPLTDKGLGDALKYFDTGFMTQLEFNSVSIQGGHYPVGDGSGDVEFLPGLSAFTNLKVFGLEYLDSSNKFQISGGQFKRNINLETLGLRWTNVTFGDDAFLFDEGPPHELDKKIVITFYHGLRITNANFDNVVKLTRSSRPIELDFACSSMDFLSEKNFKGFFQDHLNNTINWECSDYLVCDVRMKWLKDNPDIYKPRISGGDCSNDRGKTIWNSDLIP